MDGRTPKLTNKISPHIQSQLPEFVQSEHPQFIKFLKHYYQFMEAAQLKLGGSNDYVIQETNSVNYILSQIEEKVVLEESVGKFQAGEIIRGETSGYTATILVDDYDSDQVLYITSQQRFEEGENVVGETSGAKAPVVSYKANPVQNIQQLLAYADTDNTVYAFLDKFKAAIMESIPETVADGISKRNLMKNIRDLYETKGTEEGHKLFFRILFDEESSLIYPRENVLRISDGQWSDDFLMRVTEIGTSDYSQIVGRVITGETSEATAVVQTVIKYKEGAQLIAELNLDRTTINGEFTIGETVNAVSNELDQLIRAEVSGIVNETTVTEQGAYYKAGDKVNFELLGSIGVQAAVSAVGAGGIDEVHIENGGVNYTYDDEVVFNNSNTNGAGASARITILGGSFVLEDETEVDNIVYEGETHHNDIVLEHVDKLLFEDGDHIVEEFYTLLLDKSNTSGADAGDDLLFEDGGRIIREGSEGIEKLLREESEEFFLHQEQQLTETDHLILEDGNNIIVETQTFTDLSVAAEATSISKIRMISNGDGYTTLPTISISSSIGSNVSSLALSRSGVGKVLGIQINNLGLGYSSIPKITMNRNIIVKDITGAFTIGDTLTTHTASIVSFNPTNRILELETPVEHFFTGDIIKTAGGAIGTVVQCEHSKATTAITAIANTGGQFVTERGHISENSMKVQDSFYYQDYSYVVRIGESINLWRDSIRRSIHPAGWNVFGEVSFATSLADAQLNSLRIRNPAAGDIIDFTGDTQTFTPELASTLRTLFVEVFGRRLGTKTDGTTLRAEEGDLLLEDGNDVLLETGDNIIFSRDITREGQEDAPLSSGTRELTLTSSVSVSVQFSGGIAGNSPQALGPTLDLLPKYAFTQPPIDSVAYAQHYPGSDGFRSRAIRADNEGAYYTLNQFGHIRVDQVSVRSDVTGRTNFSNTSIKFDQEDKYQIETNSFDETNIIIPLSAYRTKTNVPPPGEIFISRGLRINGFDDTFRSFDDNRQEFSEATAFGTNRFDTSNLKFDFTVNRFDQNSVKFDANNVTFDPATFDERIFPRDTSATRFESFDSTSRLFDVGSLAGLFDSTAFGMLLDGTPGNQLLEDNSNVLLDGTDGSGTNAGSFIFLNQDTGSFTSLEDALGGKLVTETSDTETPYTFDMVIEQFDEAQGGAISSSVTYDEGT